MAVVAVLGARHAGFGTSAPHPAVARPLFIGYDTVQGDTATGVAAAFAADPAKIAQQAGVSDTHAALAPGTSIRVDASRLWTHLSSGPLARTESLVESTARRFGVEPALAVAVAWQESKLDERARSDTGAIGIMQVEPDTSRLAARDLQQTVDPYDPGQNVVAGIFWLHSLLTSYGGDRTSALAAYYEGPGNLARVGYLPGTHEYVARALQIRAALLDADPHLTS